MGDSDSLRREKEDHDLLIELKTMSKGMRDDLRRILDTMPSRDSVQRAHQRIDTLQKYLLGVAAVAAIEALAIIKMLLLDKQ